MIRIVLSILIITTLSYADAQRYFIQLGSFKNLQGLEKTIQSLPPALRSHIVVVSSGSWFIPFAYYVRDKRSLYPHVSKFKAYFPDSKIKYSTSILKYPVVRNYVQKVKKTSYLKKNIEQQVVSPQYQNVAISEEDNTLNLQKRVHTYPIAPSVSRVIINKKKRTRYPYFSKKMLSGNHYYLAYKATQESPNLLIKVNFENHKVVYQPVIGDMQMTDANYLIENKKLYMFANDFTKNGAYSTLDQHGQTYFLVSSWTNGKKLNTLRYYYELNDAKKYLGLKTSKGLAHVLEKGSYDEHFINEEE